MPVDSVYECISRSEMRIRLMDVVWKKKEERKNELNLPPCEKVSLDGRDNSFHDSRNVLKSIVSDG